MSRAVTDLFIDEANNTEQSELVTLFTLELADTYLFGSGLLGSNQLNMNIASDFTIGQSISIDGIETPFRVIDILDDTLYLDAALPVSVTNVKVYFTLILNIADSNYDIMYDGITYIRFPVKISELTISTDGSVDKPTISVGNVTREIMYYVEQYDGLVNRKVIVKKVFKRFLDKIYTPNVDGTVDEEVNPEKSITSYIREEFIIDSYAADEKVVRFFLEPIIDLDVKLPRRRYLDSNSCSFKYKDPETCKYSGDLPTCYKNLTACKEHSNTINFGGFAGLDSTNQRRIWL